jgi:hypothetical protein
VWSLIQEIRFDLMIFLLLVVILLDGRTQQLSGIGLSEEKR